jgi:hypothetical protein
MMSLFTFLLVNFLFGEPGLSQSPKRWSSYRLSLPKPGSVISTSPMQVLLPKSSLCRACRDTKSLVGVSIEPEKHQLRAFVARLDPTDVGKQFTQRCLLASTSAAKNAACSTNVDFKKTLREVASNLLYLQAIMVVSILHQATFRELTMSFLPQDFVAKGSALPPANARFTGSTLLTYAHHKLDAAVLSAYGWLAGRSER